MSARVSFQALSVGALFQDDRGFAWRKIELITWRTKSGHRRHANAISAEDGHAWLREWSPNAKVAVDP